MKGLKHPLVLLLAVSSLASCRLVNNFVANNNNGGCPQFFLNGQSPTILRDNNNVNRYRQICQVYMGADRFATLYDTKYKIPVYSAYLHVPHDQTFPRINEWWTEPELNQFHQASNRDYTGSGYDKGHLYPAYSNNDLVGMDATFTLTNAAPQDPNFNKQWFNKVEKPVNQLMQKNCGRNQGYIVTGVVPGGKGTKTGVRVAEYFWTAYCCWDNNKKIKAQGAFFMYSNGDLNPNTTNIQNLENVLKNFYGQNFRVFGGQC